MAEYTDDDARDAKKIVESLLEDPQADFELKHSLVISDLEADAAEFTADLELLKAIGADAPALSISSEDFIPIALSLIAGPSWQDWPYIRGGRRRYYPFFDEWLYELRSSLSKERTPGGIHTVSRKQARSTFLSRATDFLATRIAAIRTLDGRESHKWPSISQLNMFQRVGGPQISTPGCNFTVSTNSNGLRVFWSGAYRISPNYFSHPTTPTTSVLQAGTYVFGVDGGAYGNVIQWDTSAVISLPGIPYTHLHY